MDQLNAPQPHLLKHLRAIQPLLANDNLNKSCLQKSCFEIAAAACGQRDEASETLGAKGILSLIKNSYGPKLQSSFELLEHVKCLPGEIISALDKALRYKIQDEKAQACEGALSSLFTLSQSENSERRHSRTLLAPEQFRAVLDVLFALQIGNPHLNSMHLVQKSYLDSDVVLDVSASGEVSLWWGASVASDQRWISAVWMSKL
jgi:hypothetical protein